MRYISFIVSPNIFERIEAHSVTPVECVAAKGDLRFIRFLKNVAIEKFWSVSISILLNGPKCKRVEYKGGLYQVEPKIFTIRYSYK